MSWETEARKEEYFNELEIRFEEKYGTASYLLLPNSKTNNSLAIHSLSKLNHGGERPGSNIMSNYFQIYGDTWNITGGDQDDVFEIHGHFSGRIHGRGGTNDIHLLDKERTHVLNLAQKHNNFGAEIINIQRVFGVELWPEHVIVGCDTKLVSLEGGRLNDPDVIVIPPEKKDCNHHLQIEIMAIGSSAIKGGNNSFTVQVEPSPSGELNFSASYKLGLDTKKIFFLNLQPKTLNSYATFMVNGVYKIIIQFGAKLVAFDFGANTESVGHFINNQDIIFTANTINTALLVDKTGSLLALHEVREGQGSTNNTIEGALGCSNHCNIFSGDWTLLGGNTSDTFNIMNKFTGKIVGGGGGNTLSLDNTLNSSSISVDLGFGSITSFGLVELHNITIFSGRTGQGENITVGCETRIVSAEGGRPNDLDYVYIPTNKDCSQNNAYNLSIFVNSYTVVENYARSGRFAYIVAIEENFTISTTPGGAYHEYRFEFGLSRLSLTSFTGGFLSVELVTGRKLTFLIESTNNPKLNFIEHWSRVDFHVLNGEVQTSILISSTPPYGSLKTISGICGASNEIVIDVGADGNLGKIIGAELDDIFTLITANMVDSLDGGKGRNTIKIEDSFCPKGTILQWNLKVPL